MCRNIANLAFKKNSTFGEKKGVGVGGGHSTEFVFWKNIAPNGKSSQQKNAAGT